MIFGEGVRMRFLVQFNAVVESTVVIMQVLGHAETECEAHKSWCEWAHKAGHLVVFEKLGPDAIFQVPSFMKTWNDRRVLDHYANFDLGDVRRSAYNNLSAGEKFPDWRAASRLTPPDMDFTPERPIRARTRDRLVEGFFPKRFVGLRNVTAAAN